MYKWKLTLGLLDFIFEQGLFVAILLLHLVLAHSDGVIKNRLFSHNAKTARTNRHSSKAREDVKCTYQSTKHVLQHYFHFLKNVEWVFLSVSVTTMVVVVVAVVIFGGDVVVMWLWWWRMADLQRWIVYCVQLWFLVNVCQFSSYTTKCDIYNTIVITLHIVT